MVVGVAIIAGGAWYFMQEPAVVSEQAATTPAANDTTNTTPTNDTTPTASTGTQNTGTQNTGSTGAGVSAGVTVTAPAAKTVTVTYSGNGFSPSSVTINKGDTVKFVSTDTPMWVASASHPSHTVYDGTDRSSHCAAGYTGAKPFDQCADGTSYSFTFNQTGTFSYHDHTNASAGGSVIVK